MHSSPPLPPDRKSALALTPPPVCRGCSPRRPARAPSPGSNALHRRVPPAAGVACLGFPRTLASPGGSQPTPVGTHRLSHRPSPAHSPKGRVGRSQSTKTPQYPASPAHSAQTQERRGAHTTARKRALLRAPPVPRPRPRSFTTGWGEGRRPYRPLKAQPAPGAPPLLRSHARPLPSPVSAAWAPSRIPTFRAQLQECRRVNHSGLFKKNLPGARTLTSLAWGKDWATVPHHSAFKSVNAHTESAPPRSTRGCPHPSPARRVPRLSCASLKGRFCDLGSVSSFFPPALKLSASGARPLPRPSPHPGETHLEFPKYTWGVTPYFRV